MPGDAFLRDAVANGSIRYDRLDERALQAAVAQVRQTDHRHMGDGAAYAFLINAYNILAIHLAKKLLRAGRSDERSLRRPLVWLLFFLWPVRVGRRLTNLAWLERVTMARFLRRDPRGHFAIVCASRGCPPIRPGAYLAEHLDRQLDAAAVAFMVDHRLDRAAGVLWLNRILKWYRPHFVDPLKWFVRYGPADAADFVKQNAVRIKWLPYDWSLNKA